LKQIGKIILPHIQLLEIMSFVKIEFGNPNVGVDFDSGEVALLE